MQSLNAWNAADGDDVVCVDHLPPYGATIEQDAVESVRHAGESAARRPTGCQHARPRHIEFAWRFRADGVDTAGHSCPASRPVAPYQRAHRQAALPRPVRGEQPAHAPVLRFGALGVL